MFEKFVRDFFILLATIDPIGSLSIFVGVTSQLGAGEKRRVAFRGILYAGAILLAFALAGQLLLELMEVRLASFQVAGGIILFLFGVQMIFGSGAANAAASSGDHDIAIFPLAVPSIAGPGSAMAVTMLTDNDKFGVATQAGTVMSLVAVLGITLGLLLMAERVHRIIGKPGAQVLVRVLGMILAALAVETVLEGLATLSKQWPG